MRLLSLVDQLLLLLEKRNQPMHVGGLFLFELPKEADDSFVADLVHQMQHNTTPPTAPFNQVLHNLAFWKQRHDFDVDSHLYHVNLGNDQNHANLLSYVSAQHAKSLDITKPLWECHIIEGIAPHHGDISDDYGSSDDDTGKVNQFALYFKIHHALVDGVAAIRLVQNSLSTSPAETMTLPLWALLRRQRETLKIVTPKRRAISKVFKEQMGSIKPVFAELKDSFVSRNDPSHVTTTQAPTSVLNQRVSSARQLITASYALSRFRAIAKSTQVSNNDVILAVCSGALRRYLLSMQALPSEPLIGFIPVSLRTDDSATGNQTSLVLCNLATDMADPMHRLKTISASMTTSKSRFARMNQAQVINYSAVSYAWEGINLLTNAYPKKQAFNVLISNVPSSEEDLYWNGAKLSALYPASIIFDGQALNITLITYRDSVDFGIVVCPETLSGIDSLTDYIEDELAIYEKISLHRH